MKLITRDTDYALRAICFIAGAGKRTVTVRELVEKLKIPRPFLRKLLQIMSKRGILESSKGLGGGFVLAQQVKKISLVDLIEIFQGHLRLNECFFKKIKCPNVKRCVLKKKIDHIEQYVIRELRAINIASLLGKKK